MSWCFGKKELNLSIDHKNTQNISRNEGQEREKRRKKNKAKVAVIFIFFPFVNFFL